MAKRKGRERRSHPRGLNLGTALVQRNCWDVSEYRIDNLSASGALLIGGPDITPGRTVPVLLCLPALRPLVVHAQVVRRQPTAPAAIAIAFADLDVELEDYIHDMVVATLSGGRLDPSRRDSPVEWVSLDDVESTRETARES